MEISEITKIEDLIAFLKGVKLDLYLFGAGVFGQIWGQFLDKYTIRWKGYIDNDQNLRGRTINGRKVCMLSDIKDKSSISISISISPGAYRLKYDDICRQLKTEGISDNQVIHIARNTYISNLIAIDVKDAQRYFLKARQVRNIFKGRRAFVIGNGPSLRISDLTKIKDEVSFGCNSLINLFDMTPFRPTVFFFEDPGFIKLYFSENDDLLFKLTSECKYVFSSIRNRLFDKYKDSFENLYYINSYMNMDDSVEVSSDITKIVYGGGTSLFLIMQIAFYMGLSEIYLLGVDFSFRQEATKTGGLVINSSVENHQENMPAENEGVYYVDVILDAWNAAKKYADAHGIKIYNATRGGKLEVFPRVDFDDLMQNLRGGGTTV